MKPQMTGCTVLVPCQQHFQSFGRRLQNQIPHTPTECRKSPLKTIGRGVVGVVQMLKEALVGKSLKWEAEIVSNFVGSSSMLREAQGKLYVRGSSLNKHEGTQR